MRQPMIEVKSSGHWVRCFYRACFILNLSLLMLALSTRHACSNDLQISSGLRQSMEANRAAQQNSIDARALEANKPIERELSGGESHSYLLTLAAGQFFHAVIDQRGIDV